MHKIRHPYANKVLQMGQHSAPTTESENKFLYNEKMTYQMTYQKLSRFTLFLKALLKIYEKHRL